MLPKNIIRLPKQTPTKVEREGFKLSFPMMVVFVSMCLLICYCDSPLAIEN
jgi:hypothetical protein